MEGVGGEVGAELERRLGLEVRIGFKIYQWMRYVFDFLGEGHVKGPLRWEKKEKHERSI